MSPEHDLPECLPIGLILMWPSAAPPPPGWLLCDGSAISRTTYKILFSRIGTTFGGDEAKDTFNVPDAIKLRSLVFAPPGIIFSGNPQPPDSDT